MASRFDVAVRKEHRAAGVGGRCVQQRRAEGEGDLRQLCGSRARGSEIISGQQNLDGCRQHSGATNLFLCIEESASDRPS